MTKIKLRTIPNVEILQTGVEYELQSGPHTFTPEDLQAVVSSQQDPAVKEPRLKLGHVGKHGASGPVIGQPVFGKFTNLRVAKDGHLLVGDMVGIPDWLADILPVTYPNRSIEGDTNWTSHTGKTHRVHVPAVSLLGVELPGVSTLEDLRVLMEEGPAALETDLVIDGQVVARYGKEDESLKLRRRKVKARSLQASDVHQRFYSDFTKEGRESWWCHELYLDPAEVIAEDEATGRMYRVPFELDGDAVKFGEPVAVQKTYQPIAAQEDDGEADDVKPALLYASRAESVPKVETEPEQTGRKQDTNTEGGGSSVDPKVLRKSLGLPEDASDEQVMSRVQELSQKEQKQAENEDENGQRKLEIPEGMILVDKEQYETITASSARGEEAWRRQQREDRDRLIAQAVEQGKFPPSRRDHYRKLYNSDPQGTKQLIASLAPGLVPVKEKGTEIDAGAAGDDAYPAHWLPEVQERKRRAEGGQPLVTQEA